MKKLLVGIALLFAALVAHATVYSLPWGPRPQFMDANGAPMSGGTLQTFLAGSTTAQVTYTDSTGGVANPTTITLTVRGETPNEVWLTGGVAYKLVLKDSSGSTVWTVDNISGVNDVTSALSEWVAGPTPTFVSATSFTLAGDQTTTFHVGRRVKTTNSGGTVYSTITASVFGASTTVTVANDSSNLDSGLSAVSYSLASANNPSISPAMVARKGTSVASAGTTNIWGIVGDYVHITGTTTITSLGTAPYAGAERTVVFDGALTLTNNATTLVLPGGANITTAANDIAIVRADTTANMIVVSYVKANGQPIVAGTAGTGISISGATISTSLSSLTNSIAVDVTLNNTGTFFSGPVVSQGTSGTWYCSGTITALDTAGVAQMVAKLWDGTTIISMAVGSTPSASFPVSVSVSGVITSPAGNLRIDVQDTSATTGVLKAAQSGTKNSTITCFRIG